MKDIDTFTRAYIECALWSSLDDNDDPLDAHYTIDDISSSTMEIIKNDCRLFQEDQATLLDGLNLEQCGHDFWLTRNGHGAGFWDRGLGDIGKRLTEASKLYGECYLYVGDDGQLYI